MSTCPTVRIKSDAKGGEGFVIINEADFNPKKHKLFDAVKTTGTSRRPKLFIKAE